VLARITRGSSGNARKSLSSCRDCTISACNGVTETSSFATFTGGTELSVSGVPNCPVFGSAKTANTTAAAMAKPPNQVDRRGVLARINPSADACLTMRSQTMRGGMVSVSSCKPPSSTFRSSAVNPHIISSSFVALLISRYS
jgi:hypothetical protein